ncbi:MAG: D-alanyl-D-alanine carboxypeptidase [Alphaproteobacteria bacterium]|nr:D-alanyl-D-alanine carboxypeptidase [Alphaproteobacteria bacterium]
MNNLPRGTLRPLYRAALIVIQVVAGWGAAGLLGLATPAAARQYASIVVDADSGAVLQAENPELRNRPASLTKMMTLYLTFEAIRDRKLTLDQFLPVSQHAADQAPTKLYLKPGGAIRVEDAIFAAVTKSANDATTVLAEAIGGSEPAFARKMTKKASALGMMRTNFRNATGLPDDRQITTARDMAILAQALYSHFPERSHYFATKEFRWRNNLYNNHNRLLGAYRGVDGIKTGYTAASGFNLVTSVRRDGRHIYAVVLGGRTSYARDQQMRKMLDQTFARITPGAYADSRQQAMAEPARKSGSARPGTAQAPKQKQMAKASRDPENSRTVLNDGAADRVNTKHWAVQVGTFQKRGRAHERARQAALVAPSLLKPAKVSIQKVDKPARTMYRALLVGLTERNARRTCEILTSKKFQCLPVPPAQAEAKLGSSALSYGFHTDS